MISEKDILLDNFIVNHYGIIIQSSWFWMQDEAETATL